MDMLAIAVAYLLGIGVGFILSDRELKIRFTQHHTFEETIDETPTDEQAELDIKEQELVQNAQRYLDDYLNQED